MGGGVGRGGENLGPVVVDQQGVLELGGATTVGGDRSPAVVPQAGPPGTDGDHRLDGEGHPRLDDVGQPGIVVVADLQIGVELLADPVTDEVPHNAEPVRLGMGLDRPADLVERPARLCRFDAPLQALPGDVDKPPGQLVDLADEEGGVGVAVDTLLEKGDVEIDDVAVCQGPIVGNAVADHFVYRGAQRLRKRVHHARILERAGVAVALERHLVACGIDLFGGHTGPAQRSEVSQGVGRLDPGPPHPLDHLMGLHTRLVPPLHRATIGPGWLGDGVGYCSKR